MSQISEFKLSGLGRKKSITCETRKEDFFWPKVGLSQDRFDAFWKYYDVKDEYVAVIEHNGFSEDGVPLIATVIEIREGSITDR